MGCECSDMNCIKEATSSVHTSAHSLAFCAEHFTADMEREIARRDAEDRRIDNWLARSRRLAGRALRYRARLAVVEAAARIAVGDDDECSECAEWGFCPRCTGSKETAHQERCDLCELRVALDLPVVVRMDCDGCYAYDETRKHNDKREGSVWLCAKCHPATAKPEAP